MTHPFRFGVTALSPKSGDEWRALARKVEGLGLSTLSVPDHIAAQFAPLPALAIAAEATETLTVGTLVLNNDLRHPALLAREAASLDVLSGGRFELGLGAGHSKPEYEAIGIPFDSARTRVARLAESVAVLKDAWNGSAAALDGAHYRVNGHRGYPPPTRPPGPRLLIGGNGRSLLRLAAREADIVGFTGMGRTLEDGQHHEPAGFGAEAVDERVSLVREAAAERFPSLELHALVQFVLVTDDRRAKAEELSERLQPLSADDILGSPFLLIGTSEQMADDLRQRRGRFGISYYTVFEPYLDALAPVVALLAGH